MSTSYMRTLKGFKKGFKPTFLFFLVCTHLYVWATQKTAMEELSLLKRLGKPEEIAAAVAFLVSSDGAYITGETIVVAGGMPSRL